MNKELYEGKFFYEIGPEKRRANDFQVTLSLRGPLDTIRYTTVDGVPEYKFVEVIAGKIVRAYKADEILVTDRAL